MVLRELTSTPEYEEFPDELVIVESERSLRLFDSNTGAITSGKKPHLVRSICTESTVFGSSASWGVCTND